MQIETLTYDIVVLFINTAEPNLSQYVFVKTCDMRINEHV
jgi:hypothetical protein